MNSTACESRLNNYEPYDILISRNIKITSLLLVLKIEINFCPYDNCHHFEQHLLYDFNILGE